MPRVSRAQTDSNRAAIEEAASTLIRARGIQGVSVADLMAEVGLTHGGFYGHFASKDALAAVACERAFAQARERWEGRVADQPPAAARAALVNAYLSPHSRDSVATGCPLTALASDVAREAPDKPIHTAYLAGTQALLDILQAQQATGDADTDHRQALVDLSTLVGALLLSRATQGSAMSDELLTAARAHLLPTPTL
ncbi:TetR/AcrR family transcriptional regulator [Rhodoferax sp. WC2427]|uniref:TetR/AcrR family transcriptional regulator n=1 Tax=Rhodoferax sp. WC2427 TaxID=3234144 RepID=UPI003467C90E